MAVSGYSAVVDRLITALGRLPGIGARSAERLAHYLLKCTSEEAIELADAIRAAKEQIRHCQVCFHLTEVDQPICDICRIPGEINRPSASSNTRAISSPSRRCARFTVSTTCCWAAWHRYRAWDPNS